MTGRLAGTGLLRIDLGRLPEIGGRIDLADAGIELDQRRNRRVRRAAGDGRSAISEQFGMQRVATPGFAEGCGGTRCAQASERMRSACGNAPSCCDQST
jgi:hypothetical protein